MSVFYNSWNDLKKRVLHKFCPQSLQFFVHIGTLYIRKTMFLLIEEKSNRSLDRFFYVQGYSLVLWYRKFAANHERMLTPKSCRETNHQNFHELVFLRINVFLLKNSQSIINCDHWQDLINVIISKELFDDEFN